MEDQPGNDQVKTEAVEEAAPVQSAIEKPTVMPDTPAKPEDAVSLLSSKPEAEFKKREHKKVVMLIAAIVVLVGAGVAAYLLLTKSDTKKSATVTPASSNATTQAAGQSSATPKTTADIVAQGGATILATPKKLDNLKLIKDYSYFGQDCPGANMTNCKNTYTEDEMSYYQVGTNKDKKNIVVMYAKPKDISSSPYFVFIETSTSKYSLLAQHDYSLSRSISGESKCTACVSDAEKAVASNVAIDKNTVLTDIRFPGEATAATQKLKTDYTEGYFLPMGTTSIRGSYFGDLKSDQTATKFGSSGVYDFYQVVYKTTSTYKVVELYGTLGTTFASRYNPNGELANSSEKMPITWKTGDTTAISAYSGGAGCGSTGYVIAAKVDEATLTQVGTSKAGQKIYQLPLTDALFNEIYDVDYAPNSKDLSDASLKSLTAQQFSDKHGFFLVKNGLGEYVVFQRSDMFNRGGCGKPVVYLYPTETTNVAVKVGADVVVSNPTYTANGWQNVLARPDGSLTYLGKDYDSLYWEGYGHGAYPSITAGAVVKSADAVTTINSQLAAQGLNAKETSDFMDYWAPKLPSTPYVRLTWFGTGQMNQLAPLTINPSPKTVIRVFLDFEGLDKPVKLAPQVFKSPLRRGFTVVEWGGLLRDGIKK